MSRAPTAPASCERWGLEASRPSRSPTHGSELPKPGGYSQPENPIEERKAAAREKATARTFGAFAEPLVEEITAGFKNKKHKKQWLSTLKTYCTSMWKKPIEAIDTADVLGVLSPIWSTKSETASRLRGRIERVLDAARAMGLRSGENPARWRGHLSTLLPRRKKLTRGHHAALPYADMPAFMAELRRRTSASARGLEFLILTAARTEEVIGAKKGEVHRRNKLWTVPQERMKRAGRSAPVLWRSWMRLAR